MLQYKTSKSPIQQKRFTASDTKELVVYYEQQVINGKDCYLLRSRDPFECDKVYSVSVSGFQIVNGIRFIKLKINND
jgi:hypothetical protein